MRRFSMDFVHHLLLPNQDGIASEIFWTKVIWSWKCSITRPNPAAVPGRSFDWVPVPWHRHWICQVETRPQNAVFWGKTPVVERRLAPPINMQVPPKSCLLQMTKVEQPVSIYLANTAIYTVVLFGSVWWSSPFGGSSMVHLQSKRAGAKAGQSRSKSSSTLSWTEPWQNRWHNFWKQHVQTYRGPAMSSLSNSCIQDTKTKQSASMYTSLACRNTQRQMARLCCCRLTNKTCQTLRPNFFQETKSSCSQTRSLVKPELAQPGLIQIVKHLC